MENPHLTQTNGHRGGGVRRMALRGTARFVGSLLLFLLINGWTSLPVISAENPKGAATVRQEIEEANAKLVEAYNRHDAAAVAALYTDDAKVLPPNNRMVSGKAAIQAFWKGAMEMGVRSVALKAVEVRSDGDLAYEVGSVTLNIKPPGGEARTQTDKYVIVWKRQADGSWKLAVDIWNSNPSTSAK